MTYDVAVLGAGPGGYEAAIRCAQLGMKTALIEARELGGTCLNRGCIPTKALLHAAELYENAKEAPACGVFTGEVSFDYAAMAAYKDGVVSKLRKGVGALMKAHGVSVIAGYGALMDAHNIAVGGETVSAENIILATGAAPARPNIPGVDSPGVLTSDDVLSMTALPESFIMIGGGVIGIEFATLFATLGKKVTVLEALPSILADVDADIVKHLTRELKKKGVRVVAGARVGAIEERAGAVTARYDAGGGEESVSADCVVLCAGRVPQTAGIGLEAAGVETGAGFVVVDEHMRTSVPNIYAIGDITGKMQLAHVATAQGMVAAACCAGKDERMAYGVVPACVYTSPEIASVGLTQGQAEEEGRAVKIGSFNVAANGKATVMGVKAGMAKVVCDAKTGKILGAQIMAPRATDMIAGVAAVMNCGGGVSELGATIHPHPTISEIIMEAAHDVEGLCCNAAPKKAANTIDKQ